MLTFDDVVSMTTRIASSYSRFREFIEVNKSKTLRTKRKFTFSSSIEFFWCACLWVYACVRSENVSISKCYFIFLWGFGMKNLKFLFSFVWVKISFFLERRTRPFCSIIRKHSTIFTRIIQRFIEMQCKAKEAGKSTLRSECIAAFWTTTFPQNSESAHSISVERK